MPRALENRCCRAVSAKSVVEQGNTSLAWKTQLQGDGFNRIMLARSESRYHPAFLVAGLRGAPCGARDLRYSALVCSRQLRIPLKRWSIGGSAANKRAPAHKTQVIRLTIRLAIPHRRRFGKRRYDLRKWTGCRGVIGPLSNRDIRLPKMTNTPRSSTVPVSPERVTEE